MKILFDFLSTTLNKAKRSNFAERSRSRVLIHHQKEILIAVNFKCGFSTLNHVAKSAGLDITRKDLRHLTGQPIPHKFSNYTKVLISRNPVDRFLSYYHGWIVDKREFFQYRGETTKNFAYTNMHDVMAAPDYSNFIGADSAALASNEFISLYLGYFPAILMRDSHTHPQYFIYTEAGLSVEFFDEVIDTSEISTKISDMLEIDIPIVNRSSYSRHGREEVLNTKEKAIIESIYMKDFLELKYPLR
jgi:hypothetical protein